MCSSDLLPVREGYGAFCQSLDKALNITAGELAARLGDQELDDAALADAAIHFSLLSYAAGVAGSRCVALLRERKAPPKGKKEKERE